MLSAFRIEFGRLSPEAETLYDAMVEHIANGFVIAHRSYLVAYFQLEYLPTLDQLRLRYRLPEGRVGDLACQVVPIGAAFFDEVERRGSITCYEAAVHYAACEQAMGRECWVRISRQDGSAHASVYYMDGREYDPAAYLLIHGEAA